MLALKRHFWSARRTPPSVLGGLLLCCWHTILALNPALDVDQYAHSGQTVRDGFSLGNIYAMAQTPDGYLWLGSEFGLFRFDGVRSVQWQPPPRENVPRASISALLVTRDGTLWIGTFAGLFTLNGDRLTRYPQFTNQFVTALLEDRAGTVWVGTMKAPGGQLCAIQQITVRCQDEDGTFGRGIWALYEDSSGTLWAGAQSGLWRMAPGAPRHYAIPSQVDESKVTPGWNGPIGMATTDDGALLIALHDAGLMRLVGDVLEPYPIRSAGAADTLLRDRDIDSNKLLRDRDGGLWIATVAHGLIHVHHGRTDLFAQTDGLAGDIILSLFEDREGNVWVGSTGGLDHFREFPVSTLSVKQGLASAVAAAVLATADGSVWVGTHDGLTRWNGELTKVFRRSSGLLDDATHSLFQDAPGRIWVSSRGGLAYLEQNRFVGVKGVPGGEVHFITGDKQGNLWLAEHQSLLHLQGDRLVEQVPWSAVGRQQNASALLAVPDGGIWMGFWNDGGLSYYRDGQLRVSYTAANGLGEGAVADLRLDHDGALWVATAGGASRLKDGRISTLTSRNGLPCSAAMWTLEDDDGAFWLYTACGLVRIARTEMGAWIADPTHRMSTAVLDAGDGVRLSATAASAYAPRATKSSDGKLWFLSGGGVQVVDPRHLALNKLPPPVHIERIIADRKTVWQNFPDTAVSNLPLPALTRDLEIEYAALSLVAPDRNLFRYKLEGRDREWYDAGNRHRTFYTDLAPGKYRFRVMASNNSGVWNEAGAAIDFSVAPAYWQTMWFRALCVIAALILLAALYWLRIRQLAHEFDVKLEARVQERTRIARELHDTLLQSFNGLLLRFRTVHELFSKRPEEAQQILESALNETREALTQGRKAVQGLRADQAETHEFSEAIRTLAQELAQDLSQHSTAVRLNMEGTPRTLRPLIRDEIYRIVSEALRNAFRHAQASRIEVQLGYDERQFELRVRDDGKGIDPDLLRDDGLLGHFGLRGMRERAQNIGGKFTAWSALASGTELVLTVPGDIAYDGTETVRRTLLVSRKNRPKADKAKS